MSPLLIACLTIVGGLVLLVLGADRFVDAAADLARRLRLNPVIVGAMVIGVGTSLPEMIVGAMASLDGVPGLAIGNAVGSNIANVGLVLGVSAPIAPLVIDSQTRRCELPAMLLVTVAVWGLVAGGALGVTQGIALVVLLVAVLAWMTWDNLRQREAAPAAGDDDEDHMPRGKLAISLIVGLVLLLVGSRLLVDGATALATAFGVPNVVIGLTIVAIGTSLPELAAAVSSVLKRELGLAFGNVVGSNIFNLLAVLAMPALIAPGAVPASLLTRDYPVMVGLCVVVALCAYLGRQQIGRAVGVLFLFVFAAFQYVAYATAIPVS